MFYFIKDSLDAWGHASHMLKFGGKTESRMLFKNLWALKTKSSHLFFFSLLIILQVFMGSLHRFDHFEADFNVHEATHPTDPAFYKTNSLESFGSNNY